jgi:hypothetical protein
VGAFRKVPVKGLSRILALRAFGFCVFDFMAIITWFLQRLPYLEPYFAFQLLTTFAG